MNTPSSTQRRHRLLGALRDPRAATAGLGPGAWSALVADARACNLLGTLAEVLHQAGADVPPAAARHLLGARRLAERQRLSVRWEAHALQAALGGLGVPIVLLKGAAYVMSPRGLGAGRMFGDIDLLVPREALAEVESTLMLDGWVSAKTSAYDQRYYRQWMHEIPPLTHLRRGTVLDVHHTILPLTARQAPDPRRIVDRATPLPGLPALRLPALEDLLIHSLVHLVHEGELHHALRDLWDIDTMVRVHGAEDTAFWPRLTGYAVDNDLAGPVGLGLRLAARLLHTPVPADVGSTLRALSPPLWCRPRLEARYERALPWPGAGDGAAARLQIYLRAHALRMPLPMLTRHLAVKAWKGLVGPDPAAG